MKTCGVNFRILKESAFPQLAFENKLTVERLFAECETLLDVKTGRLNFENFVKMVGNFTLHNMGEKIDRMFKTIDEDGNGMLSYEEINGLCLRSLSTF